jgi:uncharacterized BrkB/YihY/UPF0761 family membrane protein
MQKLSIVLIYAIGLITTISALIFSFAFVVAYSDSQFVCPDGNQCSDAKSTMLFSLSGVLIALLFMFLCFRFVRNKRPKK